MANWWENDPVVSQPAQGQWWANDPVVSAQPAPTVGGQAGGDRSPDAYWNDLPTPGNPNFDPNRPQTQNFTFGTSRGATLNPLPAIAAAGNEIAANVPIVGPSLKAAGEKVDAFFGGTTPEDIAARNAEMSRQNPEAATTGKVVGAVAPYLAAAEVPLVSQALGMTGPMMQRLFMSAASQEAINTGDNMAHGQDFGTAAKDAVLPSLMAAPDAVLGPSGVKMTPERAAALDVMRKANVPLTGGQSTMNKKMMYAESQLGGQAAQAFQDTQLKAFTKEALKAAGVNADVATPEVLRNAYDAAGKRFEALAAATTPKIDMGVQTALLDVADQYAQAKGVNAAPVLENIINRIGTMAARNGGVLKGDQYRTITTDIRKYAEGSSDVELKTALGELREVLDDAVEQSMGGKTLEAWRKVRAQYRNLITVTDAVSGGGEMALQGIIDPVSLNNAVRNNVGKRSYAKGYGDLNELSRAGRLVMPKLPDSGSASRIGAMTGAGGLPLAAHFASQGDVKGLAATVAASATPYAVGRALLSKPGRAFIARDGSKIPNAVLRALAPQFYGQ